MGFVFSTNICFNKRHALGDWGNEKLHRIVSTVLSITIKRFTAHYNKIISIFTIRFNHQLKSSICLLKQKLFAY